MPGCSTFAENEEGLAMEYPHWLMVASAVLVVLGFVGFALLKNNAEPAEDNLAREVAPPEGPPPETREDRVDLSKLKK
jgi:hypothetical protein